MSASGTAVQGFHIIDPRSGQPATHRTRCWAKAPTAAEADALSTAFMVMADAEIALYCQRHPDVSAYFVTPFETLEQRDTMTTIPRRDFLGTVADDGHRALAGPPARRWRRPPPRPSRWNWPSSVSARRAATWPTAAAQIPGVRFRALCDIWPYRLQYGANRLKDYRQKVNLYADYREMLDKEKGLDAVVIATPDFVHAEQTKACLAAGVHVYCESMMADSIDAARSMIRAAKQPRACCRSAISGGAIPVTGTWSRSCSPAASCWSGSCRSRPAGPWGSANRRAGRRPTRSPRRY